MNTTFGLFARFESTTISLDEVSEEFLGITPKTAKQRAKAADLPFPVFKLRDSERAPYFVNAKDLGEFIDEKYKEAREEWESVNVH